MTAADRVVATVYVDVPIADAFEVFTVEIDQWWRRGPAYRVLGRAPGLLHLEPKLGGRIFEQDTAGAPVHEVGRVTAWRPPAHVAFTWRSVTFAPGEETTVDVRFAARGAGTEVTVVHAGWARIRPDHPVRHGEASAVFLGRLGRWWGALLTGLREHAGARPAPPE